MPQARDVNDSIVKSCDDSTAKMNYISLDTIKGTKDTSTSLSRSNDEKDEVQLILLKSAIDAGRS
ncbi:hypothetical protein BIW11_04542 [Tropilaelaps mercedesae]|uniref:Uncharacterized protein n=1 Tax=Tropilaelaps mercedesae TaxID=418985 RepID=A0A1V9X4H8_9ACAR|nr:hypothetical protein BIW11_04542 [Tropilaelaps mercedesae]